MVLGEEMWPLEIGRKNQKQLSKGTEMEMWYLSGEMRVLLNKMEPAPVLENTFVGKSCLRPLGFWKTEAGLARTAWAQMWGEE